MYDDQTLEEIFEFLDDLRETGLVNMFGSSAQVHDAFGGSEQMARGAVTMWMATFDPELPVSTRVAAAVATAEVER